MAVMTVAQRAQATAELMREWSNTREATGTMLKSDARAAVDAVDQWINDNSGSYNTALPAGANGARTNLTTAQKSRLLRDILRKRVELGVD